MFEIISVYIVSDYKISMFHYKKYRKYRKKKKKRKKNVEKKKPLCIVGGNVNW